MSDIELTAIVSTVTVGIVLLFVWSMTYTLTNWYLKMWDRLEQRRQNKKKGW